MTRRIRRLLYTSSLDSRALRGLVLCGSFLVFCLHGTDVFARSAAAPDAEGAAQGDASDPDPNKAGLYLDVGTGVGGFFATSGEETERTFRGFSPFQLSSHFGVGNRTLMAGLGLHFERIDWLSADPDFDVNGSPLLDPDGLTFSTLSVGFFARLTPPAWGGLGVALGVFHSSMGTDRGDAEDPTGVMFYGEVSYDFRMSEGMAFGPVLRAQYHDLSVNDTGTEADVQVFQPSLGIALRILP